jgi:hypothetical protein
VRRIQPWSVAAGLLLGVGLGLGLGFGLANGPSAPNRPATTQISEARVTVPEILTTTESTAEMLLSQAGLAYSVTEATNPNVAVGLVQSQKPIAGSRVPRRTVVRLWVSTGPGVQRAIPSSPICGSAQLSVTAGRGGAAAGHIGLSLVFANTSSQACSLSGYPRVAGLDSQGNEVTQAQRTPSGYMGGLTSSYHGDPLPTVTLQPGGRASALIEVTDVPTGTSTTYPSYAALLVTPPNTFQSVRLSVPLPGCSGLQVHPVVAGLTGRSSA